MNILSTYLIVVVWLLILAIPIGFITRLVATLFSQPIRARIRKHPYAHISWGVVSVLIVVPLLLPIKSTPRPQTHAKAYAKSIEMAIRQYSFEYGRFPLQTNLSDHLYITDGAELIKALRGLTDNPRKLIFLEIPKRSLAESGEFLDYWGHPFNVIADWSGDGKLTVGTEVVSASVAVWSRGKNAVNEHGSGDDIASWK